MPYVYQEYPRHLHKAGALVLVVNDAAEQAAGIADGWSLTPVVDQPPMPATKVLMTFPWGPNVGGVSMEVREAPNPITHRTTRSLVVINSDGQEYDFVLREDTD